MKFYKKCVCIFSALCILFVGCKSSYISDKNEISIIETEDKNSEETLKTFSLYTSISVKYDGKECGENVVEIDKDKTTFMLNLYCEPDITLGWNEFPVRLYVVDSGKLVPFAVENSEYDVCHDVTYNANKDVTYRLDLEKEELSSSTGKIGILALFNPKILPGLGIYGFSGTRLYCFYYSKEDSCQDDNMNINSINKEYIDIPKEYLGNAKILDIGPEEIYEENYTVKNIHYSEDVEVNDVNELYLYLNLGVDNWIDGIAGIVCDGRLLKFEDGNYFKTFSSNNGEKTLKYNLGEFNIESGLHYFQIVYMSNENIEEIDNAKYGTSKRYRVNIRGDM